MSILPAPATVQLGGHKIAYEALDEITVTEDTPNARVFAEWSLAGLDATIAATMIAGLYAWIMVQSIGKVGTGVDTGQFGVRSALTGGGFNVEESNSWIGATSFVGRHDGASGLFLSDNPLSSTGKIQIFANVNAVGQSLTLRRRKINGLLILPPGAVLARVI